VVGCAALVLMAVLDTLPAPESAWALGAGLMLGAFGLAAIGTFSGAVSAFLRARRSSRCCCCWASFHS
jgi:hypothetical protein